jgi:transposase-like protein
MPGSVDWMKQRYLRADTKGRVWTPRERKEQLLDEFEQTGASAAAFARIVGVRYSTFAAWVNRRKKECRATRLSSSQQSVVRFVEAAPTLGSLHGQSDGGLEVELPGGGRMKISSFRQVELAVELLSGLERKGARAC